MYIRWTSYSCPSCGAHTESRIVSSPRVGVENRKCEKCGFSYRTPDREWNNMTKGQRIGYFLSEWTIGWLFLFILVGLTFANENLWLRVLYGLFLGAVWCLPSWMLKLARVRSS